MALYIVRPKRVLSQSLSMAARSFTPARRAAQVREALDTRKADRVDQEIRSRLKSMSNIRLLTTSDSDTPVTGSKIVDMSADQANTLRQEMPEALVLRDRPIDLIQPVRATAAKKKAVTAKDLWHEWH